MAFVEVADPPPPAFFAPDELVQVAHTVFERWGVSDEVAAATAASLVESNLLGHDSHGILRLMQYSDWVRNGQIAPGSAPAVRRARGCIAVIDGAWGLGQPAAQLATRTAAVLAQEHGAAVTTIERCNHVGRLGEYVSALAQEGLVAMAFCNSGPVVAVAGGTAPVLGTNPFAWAAPRAAGSPFVLDFSTAALPEGKLQVARSLGLPVPPGVILDAHGRSSQDPADFYAGGTILPFGGHKGAGLCFMIELVGGLLSGMGCAPMADYEGGNGTVLIALSVADFGDLTDFADRAEAFAHAVQDGHDAVLLPGDVEARTRAERVRTGVPVPDTVRRAVTTLYAGDPADLGTFALTG